MPESRAPHKLAGLTRRQFALACLAAGGALAYPRRAAADAVYNVGDIELTAISDGNIDLDPAVFQQFKPERLDALMREIGGGGPPLKTSVNAYLARAGGKTILIDCGSGPTLGKELGKISGGLAAIGASPEDIDVLVLTHLHPDHAGGAMTADGSALFPKAQLFVASKEVQYWQDEANLARSAEAVKFFFKIARGTLAAYRGRITEYGAAEEILPGFETMALPGHTPGHSGIFVRSGASEILVWGDIVNSPPIQFAHPDWTLMPYDVDGGQAAATRARMFDMAWSTSLTVAGMHLPFPGIGSVARKQGRYRFLADDAVP